MMAGFTLGVIMGFLGSWHCVGMCGPLAMALPYRTTKVGPRFTKSLLYTFGRTTTYLTIGLFFATLGEGFTLAGLQRSLSLIVGLVLLALVFYPSWNRRLERAASATAVGRWVQRRIARLYQSQKTGTFFLVGILNGLLPCGMVYMASFAALGSANLFSGMLIMLGFGLGTLPMMTMLSILPVREWLARFQGFKLTHVLMFAAGTIMIVRATALELPDVPAMGVFNPSQLTICQ